MKLPALLVSDTHFTARPADKYRWDLFPWLRKQCKEHHIRTLIHLGDLTDEKDYHSAILVNQVVAELHLLSYEVEQIYVLAGNHDYLKAGLPPYFAFLSTLPKVHMIYKPEEDLDAGYAAFFLPHTREPAIDWRGMDLSHYNYIFMHQTLRGAVASNGQKMTGEDMPDMSTWGKIYSGDIHVPQRIGPIEYVGSPYHVHFGDRFKPRCIVIDRMQRKKEIHFETINRLALKVGSLRELKQTNLIAGSQVKVTIKLAEAEKHDWLRIRREATEWLKESGVECHGIALEVQKSRQRIIFNKEQPAARTPEESVLRFVEREELTPDIFDTGMECLE